jgi:choline kinase
MKAVMLAAGVGARLGKGAEFKPKVLLEFGGRTLLERHVEILRYLGFEELVMGIGHQAGMLRNAIADMGVGDFVRTVHNPIYEQGAITTLWALRDEFRADGPVIMMDADVLYDYRMLDRLARAEAGNCFLLDRDIEPGEEPVKLCFRDGVLVDFHKRPDQAHDSFGEWIGFLKLSPEMAARVPDAAERFLENDEASALYEIAIRHLLLTMPAGSFGVEDVTGLPWIEIDFVEDVARAEREILPRLESLP